MSALQSIKSELSKLESQQEAASGQLVSLLRQPFGYAMFKDEPLDPADELGAAVRKMYHSMLNFDVQLSNLVIAVDQHVRLQATRETVSTANAE